MSASTLWYFADPMCSWCWGFSPVVGAIKAEYGARLKLSLVLGELRPGTTEALSPRLRGEILHHWREVQRRTGQPFLFEGALPERFVYDTEPPCRAVIAVAENEPGATFRYFERVQAAFYAEGRDVTQADTLAALAQDIGIEQQRFLDAFASRAAKEKTSRHFEQARKAGITGFPTTVLQRDDQLELLSAGYRSFGELKPRLDAWLSDSG